VSAFDGAVTAHDPTGPTRLAPPATGRRGLDAEAGVPVRPIPAGSTADLVLVSPAGDRLRPSTKSELFKLAMNERRDPEPFYTKLAETSIAEFPFPLRGRTVLDLGSGPGHYTRALARAGARVVALDLGAANVRIAADAGLPAVRGDALTLPFPSACFDGIFCSNMLEHVPDPAGVVDEIERLLRPGGWAWISWTNWYSPWGGHHITPFHFLGPRLGSKAYVKVTGHEPVRNQVYAGLWPTYVGRVLTDIRSRPGLRMLDAVPRYYPTLRWILRVPGLREVATWNCLILAEKTRRRLPEREADVVALGAGGAA
jgi:SAM-dependent methyltransferase